MSGKWGSVGEWGVLVSGKWGVGEWRSGKWVSGKWGVGEWRSGKWVSVGEWEVGDCR